MGNVYKFLEAKRSAFLDNGLLRFSQPAALNDPYECLAAFPDLSPEEMSSDLLKGVLETVGYSKSDSREDKLQKSSMIGTAMLRIKAMFEEDPWLFRNFTMKLNQDRINKDLGVLSLSRRWNSALMWSHYTKIYSGFCVGFDSDHGFFREFSDGGELRRTSLLPVKYSKKRLTIPKKQSDAVGLDIFLTKSVDWKYEEEDRLLALLKDADKVDEKKPYSAHLFKIPFDAVSEVILGHNAPEALRVDVLEFGKKLGIPVYKTQLSQRSFDVDRVPLKDGICF
ncbi:DUF2971 domain-containing protein [Pseudomonas monsensis]|uniref:DUF2971 domain-containing protein n=1 Tax=Pseudomonas monsensis TaxID=2745509 RepID=UPI003D1C505E